MRNIRLSDSYTKPLTPNPNIRYEPTTYGVVLVRRGKESYGQIKSTDAQWLLTNKNGIDTLSVLWYSSNIEISLTREGNTLCRLRR